jgi:transcriptional regulator with XRE-family HTH domain
MKQSQLVVENFGAILLDELDRMGMAHYRFAAEIGVTPGTVSNYLSGRSVPGSFQVLKNIARVCERSVVDFISDEFFDKD